MKWFDKLTTNEAGAPFPIVLSLTANEAGAPIPFVLSLSKDR
jgi:hypothetical protein